MKVLSFEFGFSRIGGWTMALPVLGVQLCPGTLILLPSPPAPVQVRGLTRRQQGDPSHSPAFG
jgi:hypothetical protein